MIRFGRQCVAEGNWRTDIPQVRADAHLRSAGYAGDPAYWLRPGVWDDVRVVYEGCLRRNCNPVFNRNQLARYAVLCHPWKAADQQFSTLGLQADAASFGDGTSAALDAARETAARLADPPDAQGW